MTDGSDPPCHPERSEGSETEGRRSVIPSAAKDLKQMAVTPVIQSAAKDLNTYNIDNYITVINL